MTDEFQSDGIPDDFKQYSIENDIDLDYLKNELSLRYVRMRADIADSIYTLAPSIPFLKVVWLSKYRVYALDAMQNICDLNAFKNHEIFGMDAASVVTVMALSAEIGDVVLDLCCCPGAKLSLLIDLVGENGSVSGVDISEDRMRICASQLAKRGARIYNPVFGNLSDGSIAGKSAGSVFLYREDGKTFDPCKSSPWMLESTMKRMKKTLSNAKRQRDEFFGKETGKEENVGAPEAFKILESSVVPPKVFRKILVDVECTHDGSSRHVRKSVGKMGWDVACEQLCGKERMKRVSDSQLACLENAFALLEQGGELVYSTCSLSYTQNENVINRFLKNHPTAKLHALPFSVFEIDPKNVNDENSRAILEQKIEEGEQSFLEVAGVPCRVRMKTKENEPAAILLGGLPWSPTDGQFICKIKKKHFSA
eukprot:GDKJ01062864.1.p1 GENE.GDKJ01062864.1~~GDKJ01062864.1.p1  ORF type:complete len:424 (-),score=66.28 GDKJ01062864.1:125-1396(-)